MPATAILRVKDDKGNTYDIPAIRGKDGVSIVSIERTAGNGSAGTSDTYTITLSDGKTFDLFVYNGKDGNGKNGISPTISVEEITGGHRLTITDAAGTQTVDVLDGEDLQGWATVVNTDATVNVTLADKTEYRFPNATNVTINAPSDVTEYECWISIGGTDPTISFPSTMKCVGIDGREAYSNITDTEISIKDGKYIIGCVGS